MSRYLTKKSFGIEQFLIPKDDGGRVKSSLCFFGKLKNGSPRSSRGIFYVARPQSSQALYKQLRSNHFKNDLASACVPHYYITIFLFVNTFFEIF